MRRYGFAGQPRSHGHSLSHRSGGSLGGAAGSLYATRVMPGKKAPRPAPPAALVLAPTRRRRRLADARPDGGQGADGALAAGLPRGRGARASSARGGEGPRVAARAARPRVRRLVYLKGTIPGGKGSLVRLKERLYRREGGGGGGSVGAESRGLARPPGRDAQADGHLRQRAPPPPSLPHLAAGRRRDRRRDEPRHEPHARTPPNARAVGCRWRCDRGAARASFVIQHCVSEHAGRRREMPYPGLVVWNPRVESHSLLTRCGRKPRRARGWQAGGELERAGGAIVSYMYSARLQNSRKLGSCLLLSFAFSRGSSLSIIYVALVSCAVPPERSPG